MDGGRAGRRAWRRHGAAPLPQGPAVTLPILLEHVREGRLELASLVGLEFALGEINEAVEATPSGAPGRMLIHPEKALAGSARPRVDSVRPMAQDLRSCAQISPPAP
jgi:hypothetical protein